MNSQRTRVVDLLTRVLEPPSETVKGPQEWDLMWFDDEPCEGARTVVSVGLSEKLLPQSPGLPPIRLEILMMVRPQLVDLAEVVAVMDWMGMHIEDGHPLLRGSIHSTSVGPFASAPHIVDFYVSRPVYLSDELSMDDTDFLWIVPLLPAEAAFARARGWDAFESELVAADPDLLDITRAVGATFLAN